MSTYHWCWTLIRILQIQVSQKYRTSLYLFPLAKSSMDVGVDVSHAAYLIHSVFIKKKKRHPASLLLLMSQLEHKSTQYPPTTKHFSPSLFRVNMDSSNVGGSVGSVLRSAGQANQNGWKDSQLICGDTRRILYCPC